MNEVFAAMTMIAELSENFVCLVPLSTPKKSRIVSYRL